MLQLTSSYFDIGGNLVTIVDCVIMPGDPDDRIQWAYSTDRFWYDRHTGQRMVLMHNRFEPSPMNHSFTIANHTPVDADTAESPRDGVYMIHRKDGAGYILVWMVDRSVHDVITQAFIEVTDVEINHVWRRALDALPQDLCEVDPSVGIYLLRQFADWGSTLRYSDVHICFLLSPFKD